MKVGEPSLETYPDLVNAGEGVPRSTADTAINIDKLTPRTHLGQGRDAAVLPRM